MFVRFGCQRARSLAMACLYSAVLCLLVPALCSGAAVGPGDMALGQKDAVVDSFKAAPADVMVPQEAAPGNGAEPKPPADDDNMAAAPAAGAGNDAALAGVQGNAAAVGAAAVGVGGVADGAALPAGDPQKPPVEDKVAPGASKPTTKAGDSKAEHEDPGFPHAFVASFSMITVSEIGDKTFFISAIMAMRHSRLTVFAGAITALALMHTLSAVFGLASMIIPRMYTYYASSALFAIFGVRMLREGWYMSPDEGQEEFEETQAELKKYDEGDGTMIQDPETGVVRSPVSRLRFLRPFFSAVFLKSATLNFLAEWGDRSQITAIILATREDVTGVILGGVLGHALCTGMAVICGRFISQRISVRTVTLVGGVIFLIFALSAFVVHPSD